MKKTVEEEIKRILPMIPKDPPKDTVSILKKRGFLREERLLYKSEYDGGEKKVRVICSRCGGQALLEYVPGGGCGRYGTAPFGFVDPFDKVEKKSGNTCLCPICQNGSTAMHIGTIGSSVTEIDSRICGSVHNVEGHLVMLSWVVKKMMKKDGTVTYPIFGYEGIVLIDKSIVRIKMYRKFMSSYSWLSEWEISKKNGGEIGAFSKNEIVYAKSSEIDETSAEKSAFVQYLSGCGELNPNNYLNTWLKYPNIENLVRGGYGKIISSVFSEAEGYSSNYYHRTFDIKKVNDYLALENSKPHEILGITKQELSIAKAVTYKCFLFYKEYKQKQGQRLDGTVLNVVEKWGIESVRDIAFNKKHGVKIHLLRTLNYLERQQALPIEKNGLIGIRYLTDYWDSLYKVYGSMPPELMYPKNLIDAHDEMILKVKEKEDAVITKKIADRVADLSGYCYQDDEIGLIIRPAASQAELIKEGKLLHHCVAGYAKDHGDGKTSIFFIRKTEAPNIPYYTLELKDGKVLQNRGMKNCERTDEVRAFEKKWLNFISMKERKNGTRKEIVAGA